jgi:predicted O-methyltransferase YrrM
VPIVHWRRGAFWPPKVTALEIDPDRARQARELWNRAGVAERIELIEGDARETIPSLSGPFDLLFVDAAKGQCREYLDLAEPLLSERALLVIDNLLHSAGWDRCWRSATESASRRGSSRLPLSQASSRRP